MKVITEPKVTVVSCPQYRPHPVYQLPAHDVEQENIIAMAGKVCYDSYGNDGHPVEKHVASLVASGHHSVIEHVHIGVFIEGISRGCSHEIVRHRMFNYSQRSTRYTAEDDAAIVLDPFYAELYGKKFRSPRETTGPEYWLIQDFLGTCKQAIETYAKQVKRLEALNPDNLSGRDLRKWCRGKARQLLPHALETRMVMTGNLRAWRHFLLMRTSRHAEAEIRRLAAMIFDVVAPFAPTVFSDLDTEIIGGFIEVREHTEVTLGM